MIEKDIHRFCFVFFFVMLGMEPRASHIQASTLPLGRTVLAGAKTCLFFFPFSKIIGVCLCVHRYTEPSLQPQICLSWLLWARVSSSTKWMKKS